MLVESETLSDHLYIEVVLTSTRQQVQNRRPEAGDSRSRRWTLKKLDPDLLMVSVLDAAWPDEDERRTIDDDAAWFRGVMTEACDASLPRTRTRPGLHTGEPRRSSNFGESRSTPEVCREPGGEVAAIGNYAKSIAAALWEFRAARNSLKEVIWRSKNLG